VTDLADTDLVQLEVVDRVACVTLNRPQALNALSLALRRELTGTFRALAWREDIDVVVLTGAGRAFCVGLDLKELGGEIEPSVATDEADINVGEALAVLPQPVIGAINGYAITGGFELALMCDIRIGSSAARFADTHARVGVVPGWGMTQRLPRIIGEGRAKEMSLTGNYVDADTALAWGLVNRVVAPQVLLDHCLGLAADMSETDPTTRNEIKRLIELSGESTLIEGLEHEREANQTHWQNAFSRERVAASRAQIQARARVQNKSG
jgi:enoyl-CoA hydratase